MASSTYSYSIADGHGLPHDPLPAILGPRPIGWISTINQDGRSNLAPYSFFNIINYRPPILIFSSVGKKDSVRNAQETGHFVYNLATRPLAESVNSSSTEVPDVEEFEATGLTSACGISSCSGKSRLTGVQSHRRPTVEQPRWDAPRHLDGHGRGGGGSYKFSAS